MTAREHLRECLTARRNHQRGSIDWIWLTAAARKYAWMARGVPTNEWENMT